MNKGRLEAFGDAILAIVITIMVLELRPPEGASLSTLSVIAPKFLSYLLSFIFLAIYWNNHHHLFQAVEKVNGAVLWANLHLLFWLSLVPFVTAWLGETGFQGVPVALYGLNLILSAFAYFILVRALIRLHGSQSEIARYIGRDTKGKISIVIYLLAILGSLRFPIVSLGLYVLVAAIWFIPDRRFERDA
ncbi:MAG: TMEM175 family protein [Anaerolineales bacterium]|jgi:uncharacterized membrane protein